MKRFLDISVSLAGLIVLAPAFLVLALLIKMDSPGPVFFRQERIGKGGKPFSIWKFRTMVDGAVELGMGHNTGKDDPRITRVGHVLRELSIDEWPQLIDVLKGEMSLVGPRPTLRYQVEQYTPEQRRRLDMKPGMTSWAAVTGRNSLTWEERIDLDLWYLQHQSTLLDLQIIARTAWVSLVDRRGIYGREGINDDFTRAMPTATNSEGSQWTAIQKTEE